MEGRAGEVSEAARREETWGNEPVEVNFLCGGADEDQYRVNI